MIRDEEVPGFEVPLHTAVTQPVLLAGVPRGFAILNATLAMVVGLGLHLWWLGFPAGILVHLAALVMTRHDPDWFDVMRRHLRQPAYLDS